MPGAQAIESATELARRSRKAVGQARALARQLEEMAAILDGYAVLNNEHCDQGEG